MRVWKPANIYGKPVIGDNVSIGAYCDIGDAIIDDDVRIGAFAFIPGKITIKRGAWLGPRITFTHTFPPATPDDWKETVVEEGAMIGASVTILCGLRIGKGAIVGAGSVVTRNVGERELWVGSPARKIRDLTDDE